MADYIYSTTKEMDVALDYIANLRAKTAEEVWRTIVDGDMAVITRGQDDMIKEQLLANYKAATPEDQATMISVKVSETKMPNP